MPERTPESASTDTQRLTAQASDWGNPPKTEETASQPAASPPDEAVRSFPPEPAPSPASNWSATPPSPPQPAPAPVEPAPVAAIVPEMPSGPIPDVVAENTINDMAENRVNIALFHIERLRQLVPDITGWSEQQAGSVDTAIFQLETALKGREDAGDPYNALRETLKSAKRDPRDIDVMIALADRASEIEDLLEAHDKYSLGVREALFAIKPAAVNYVAETKKRPARRRPSRRAAPKKQAPAVEKEPASTSAETADAATEGSTSTGAATETQ
jgi:hypothetical protein